MPALANSKVGSSYGMVEDDGKNIWFLDLKYLKNSSRTFDAVQELRSEDIVEIGSGRCSVNEETSDNGR